MNNINPIMQAAIAPFAPPSTLVAYHAALSKFDWDFDTRDDHSRWAEGHNSLQRLRKMQAELDPSGEIWMSYPGSRGHGAPSPRVKEVA